MGRPGRGDRLRGGTKIMNGALRGPTIFYFLGPLHWPLYYTAESAEAEDVPG